MAIRMWIEQNPVSLVFQADGGEATKTELDVPAALSLGTQLVGAVEVQEAIRLPKFVKRLILEVLFRTWQRERLAQFKVEPKETA